MNIRELRIGNWIRHENKNGVFDLQVVSIHDGAVDVKYNGGTWALSADVIAPIPLTEELLLKCGFIADTEHTYGYKSQLSDIVFDKPNDWNKTGDYPTGICTVTHYMGYNPVIIRCLYLHQLQNMVFAITSEELEIKL